MEEIRNARFEVFMVTKVEVEVFWVVMPCSVVSIFRVKIKQGPLKHYYPTTTLRIVTTQKTSTSDEECIGNFCQET
jgi:hypothetical protein